MKKIKGILLCFILMFTISGCKDNDVECPEGTTDTEQVYTEVINDYNKLYEETVRSVVKIVVQKGSYLATGSGVVFFEEGQKAYILTNAHVVKDVNSTYEVEVFFSNEDGFESGESALVPSTKIYKNVNEDVAVLEIDKSNKYQVASLGDSSTLNKGEFVYTIGSPFGKFNYTTAGYITSYNVPVTLSNSTVTSYVILTNAPINEGNSGGALFNKEGKLIGLTTFRYDQINSKEVYEMYGCLPINHVVKVAKSLMVNGSYVRPVLNLRTSSVNEMGVDRSSYGISTTVTSGVWIIESYVQGVTKEYIITEVNGQIVRSVVDLQVEILKYNVGDTVTLKIIDRKGLTSVNVSVVLQE